MIIRGVSRNLVNATDLGFRTFDPHRPDKGPSRPGYVWVADSAIDPPPPPIFESVTYALGILTVMLSCAETVDGYQVALTSDIGAPGTWGSTTTNTYTQSCNSGSYYLQARAVRGGLVSTWSIYGQLAPDEDEWRQVYSDQTVSASGISAYPGVTEDIGSEVCYAGGLGTFTNVANNNFGAPGQDPTKGRFTNFFLGEYGGRYRFKFRDNPTSAHTRAFGGIFACSGSGSDYYILGVRLGAGTYTPYLTLWKSVSGSVTVVDEEVIPSAAYYEEKIIGGTFRVFELDLQARENAFRGYCRGQLILDTTDSAIPWGATTIHAGLYMDTEPFIAITRVGITDYLEVYARDRTGEPVVVDPGDAVDSLREGILDAAFNMSHLVRWCSGNTDTDYLHLRLDDTSPKKLLADLYNPYTDGSPSQSYEILRTSVASTITAQHSFSPSGDQAPFLLGEHAQGQLVTGLDADLLDGQHGAYYATAASISGTIGKLAKFTSTTAVGDSILVEATGKIGIGLTPAAEVLEVAGRLSLLETTAPELTANYGKIYPLASDHHLYYTDASGNHGKIWTSYNDGTGSGLDADLVDGAHGPFMAEPSGTLNYHAKFTGSGTTIGNSIISDDGTTATLTGNLTYTGRITSTQTVSVSGAHWNDLNYTTTNSYTGDYGLLGIRSIGATVQQATGTGVDVSLSVAKTAFRVVLGSYTNTGSIRIRLKKSASTADGTYVLLRTYADDGGSPSKPTGAATASSSLVYAHRLSSSSYTAIDLPLSNTSPGATFWVSIEPSAYASNPVIVDSVATGSDLVATYDGANWNLTTGTIYHIVRTGEPCNLFGVSYASPCVRLTSYGTYTLMAYNSYQTAIYGYGGRTAIYGDSQGHASLECAGVRGNSTAGVGVYGTSTSYYGGYFYSSTGIGLRSDSYSSYGAYFTSASGGGCYIQSTSGHVSKMFRTGTLSASTSGTDIWVNRDLTLGAYDCTGSMVYLSDYTASTGKFIEIRKQSAALGSLNILYYLTHANDGRTVTQRTYGFDTTASAWRYWDWATTTSSTLTLAYGGTTHATFDGANRIFGYDGAAVFNEGGGDYDFRIEGDTATQLLVCDAGLDAVQIGTTSAGAIADFRSSGIVFNDSNADRDFRVASDTDPYCLMVNGGLNCVGIGRDTPAAKFHVSLTDAGTTDMVMAAILDRQTSGTAANGFGTGVKFSLESSTTADQDAAQISCDWTDATHATRTSALRFCTVTGAAALEERLAFLGTETVFNDGGLDRDFRIEGDTDTLLFNLDAGLEMIGIGCVPTAKLDILSDILRLRTSKTPASAGASGNAGDICWDADFIYVCVATDTWKKAAISTWV